MAPPRTAVLTGAGDVLLMPAATARFVGVKLATVAPGNAAPGLPRVQGIYVLLDGRTLTPVALIDGVALTALRTPAVSAVALRHLSQPGPIRVVVIGTGPQGYGHLEAVRAVRPVTHVTVAGRDRARAERMASWCARQGLPAAVVAGSDLPEHLEGPIRAADVVVCATSSRWPAANAAYLAYSRQLQADKAWHQAAQQAQIDKIAKEKPQNQNGPLPLLGISIPNQNWKLTIANLGFSDWNKEQDSHQFKLRGLPGPSGFNIVLLVEPPANNLPGNDAAYMFY